MRTDLTFKINFPKFKSEIKTFSFNYGLHIIFGEGGVGKTSLLRSLAGEGIGNAMVSAKCAIEVAKKSIKKNDFSKEMFSEYDELVWNELGKELHGHGNQIFRRFLYCKSKPR